MVKEKIQKAKKPKYNTLQNVGWMVKIAWKNGKRVLSAAPAQPSARTIMNTSLVLPVTAPWER